MWLQLRWGKLQLQTIALTLAEGVSTSTATVALADKSIRTNVKLTGNRALITFAEQIVLAPGTELHITLA